MPNVYVAGASLPTGGAYMAYRLGALICNHWNYKLFDVALYPPERPIFRYDTPMQTVSRSRMEHSITPQDVLIVNPSFSSLLFGLRLPGRKIMYAQGFTTFLFLDCHCDLYVSVSRTVAGYLRALYGLETPVIPAFIDVAAPPNLRPWHERPARSALVYMKHPSSEHRLLLERLRVELACDLDGSNVVEGRGLTQPEFWRRLGEVRYLVNLSLAEGFGLVPLEAMALGTMVTGLDGMGGRDYLRAGENSLTCSITDLRPLVDTVRRAVNDETLALRCVQAGKATAARYGYEAFKAAWIKRLEAFLHGT